MPTWGAELTRAVLVLAAALAAGRLLGWLSGVAVRRAAQYQYGPLLTHLHRSCHGPWSAVLMVAAALAALPSTGLAGAARDAAEHGLLVALIGTTAWLTIKVLYVAEDAAFRRLPMDVVDNRRARRMRTQIAMLRRLTAVAVALVAFGATLMLFAPLRTFGASLLASAGLAGVVAGLAAQATLGHVVAGLQLAFSDALRIDDVVVVENEWGRIEEIRLTSVIVRLWDERRLVLPTTYFTSTPFQNWTRNEARVMGAVLLHLDYRTPVAELRAETKRIVESSPLWDRREWVLQVVDTTPSTMVIRVLASAADGPSAWDLRCDLREKLIDFIQARHPYGLPRARVELTEPAAVTIRRPAQPSADSRSPG